MHKFFKWIAACLLSLFCLSLAACGSAASAARSIGGVGLGVSATDAIVDTSLNRKIVYTVNFTLKASNVNGVKASLTAKSDELGGYVETNDENYSGGKCTFVLVVYRIPTEKLDLFVSSIEAGGGVTSKTVYTADITHSYVDATARKEALLAEKTMLQTLLNDASISASDKVAVISKIAEVETELQTIELTIGQYDAMVNYSTVCIEISQPVGFWEIFLPVALSLAAASGIFCAIFFPVRAAKKRKKKQLEEKEAVS